MWRATGWKVVSDDVTASLLSRPWRLSAIEDIAGADCGLADSLAERLGKCVEGSPASAVTGDDVTDIEGLQCLDGLWNDVLHDAAKMQTAHHRMDWSVWKQAMHFHADVDDAGVRTGAEHDQHKIADLRHKHALVHQVRIGPPILLIAGPAEVVDTARLKRGYARDLAAVVEVPIQ